MEKEEATAQQPQQQYYADEQVNREAEAEADPIQIVARRVRTADLHYHDHVFVNNLKN